MKSNSRLDYIDVCKTIGILLVVLGHTYYGPQVLYNLIYCFHMPLFFVIAGYTYNKARNDQLGFRLFAKKKARQLLGPYVLFAFIILLLQIIWRSLLLKEVITFDYVKKNMVGIVLCYSSMNYMPNCSPIWFLLCLFLADLLFFWQIKLGKNGSWIAATVCMVVAYAFSKMPHDYNTFPWKFPVFLMASFFMYVGYMLRQFVDNHCVNKLSLPAIAVVALFTSLVIEVATGNSVGMNENNYGQLLVFLLTSIPISCAIILLCRSATFLSRIKPLIWVGRNTLYVVGFNYFCRDLATEIYYLIPGLRRHKISFIPLFLLTFGLSILCALLCSKIKTVFSSRKRYE